MVETNSSSDNFGTARRRFNWDLTYACPLRCIHCFTESGRRQATMLDHAGMRRVVDVIIEANGLRVSFGGGEPLLTPWWSEAASRLQAAGIPVTVFTSGWIMDERTARKLAECVSHVAVSVDGASERVHDTVRGRAGSFRKTMAALEQLARTKRERTEHGKDCFTLGVDCTVTRSAKDGLEHLVENVTARFPEVDVVRIGAVIPEGLAQERSFVERELLTGEDLTVLSGSAARLQSCARNGARVEVSDVWRFIPGASDEDDLPAHIEADGQLRAMTNFEAKVGNVLHEPFDELWRRAVAWRNDPFVAQQFGSIRTIEDWAEVTRILDRRYGSAADKARIARRQQVLISDIPSFVGEDK